MQTQKHADTRTHQIMDTSPELDGSSMFEKQKVRTQSVTGWINVPCPKSETNVTIGLEEISRKTVEINETKGCFCEGNYI